VRMPISDQCMELVELVGRRRGAADDGLARRAQKGLPAREEHLAEAEAHVHEAGVDAVGLRVVVEGPTDVRVAPAYVEPRDQWRQVARAGKERDSGEIGGRGKDVADSGHERSAEVIVEV